MSLIEAQRYGRVAAEPSPEVLADVVAAHRALLGENAWVYVGFTPLRPTVRVPAPTFDIHQSVDSMFRLGPVCGFETVPAVVTSGLRTSRFAPILFWEVLHILQPGGVWIDIDRDARCQGTSLIATDFLQREYFADCLSLESRDLRGAEAVTTWRKTSPTPISATINEQGWTFGILTGGPSRRAAQMAREILALDLPEVEVIFCGPRPEDAPDDPRVRAIDLERPEPRGWITRKKNMVAAAARYENLCILHDRYVVSPEWADAFRNYGACYAFLTFPHVYYAGEGKRFPQRYPDLHHLVQSRHLDVARQSHVYDTGRMFHAEYDDFSETSYCCGGMYIARRTLWQRLPQDEGLFHYEFEDVSFGLECQRRGMPHRVNMFATAESTAPHVMLLVKRHTLRAGQPGVQNAIHLTAEQQAIARLDPRMLRPIFSTDRASYFDRVVKRFNAMPGLQPGERLPHALAERSRTIAEFWAGVSAHVTTVPLMSRERIAQMMWFLSDTIFRFPTTAAIQWIREHERALARTRALAHGLTMIGWGTGAAFQQGHRHIGRELAFVVDSDSTKWGSTVAGVPVRPPSALRELDPSAFVVVVFSQYFDQIRAAAVAEGAGQVLRAAEISAARSFQPLVNMVHFLSEVERHYPNLFAEPIQEKAAA